ncbi:MAG: hypothetical protein GXO87_08665 [Chlorobi bacterium]|nr:hypothetical protein [Chlorobiota bacterium]
MNNYYEHIVKKLQAVHRKLNLYEGMAGLLFSAAVTTTLFFLFLLLETLFHFGTEARTALFYAAWGISALLTLYYFWTPLILAFKKLSEREIFSTAQFVGEKIDGIKDELLNALQLILEKNFETYSKDLVNASFKEIYERTKEIDFSSIVENKKIMQNLRVFLFAIGFAALSIVSVPAMQQGLHRLLNYSEDFAVPPKFTFSVFPGNKTVIKGAEVPVKITTHGDLPERVFLKIKETSDSEFKEKILTPDSLGAFNFLFKNLNYSFLYFAYADGIESKRYKIKVINPPSVKSLELEIIPPSYAKEKSVFQKDNGNIVALKGTAVKLIIESSKNLSGAKILFSDSSETPMNIKVNAASANFAVKKEMNYKISIQDTIGNFNVNPISYSIKIKEDLFPTLEVVSPEEKDLKVVGDEIFPVVLRIGDDYGFSKLYLRYRLSATQFGEEDKEFKSVQIPFPKNKIAADIYFNWNLSELYLAVEDVVSFYFEVYDNDFVSGPKSVKSDIFRLRIPAMNEILNEAETAQNKAAEDLKETLKEADALKKEIQKINDELKKDRREISWDEKEKIENTVEKFKELENKIKDIQEKLSETQKDLEKNNLLSKETMKKYEELQKLMDELTSDEMKKALEKLQEMMKQMNRDQTQDAFKDFQFNEEMFQKSIERTLNLLKRIQIEQKIDELVKRTEELEKKQNELTKETEKSDLNDKEQNDNLQKKQDDVSKDLEKLQKEMEALKKKMDELEDMPKEKMDEISEEMQKQDNQKMSEQAQEQMQKMMKNQAMQKQKQISQNMKKMNQMMMDLKSQMQMQNQMKTLSEMMKMINEVITLSKTEERLKEETRRLPPNSEDYNKKAEEQSDARDQLDNLMNQLSALAQKTFAVSPEMAKKLGQASMNMDQALQAMHNRNSPLAAQKQGAAMKSLNSAANMMQSAMQSMMNPSQSGGGMMSLMQQMQQLSQRQMGLNKMTQMMMQQQGKMSPGMQAQMQRLGKRQRMIQKSLDELNKEAKQSGLSKKLSENLDEILKEMKEVVSGLETQQLSDELVHKQDRVLSKMLDAQRSINEKDYEKKRESRSGNNFARKSPDELRRSGQTELDKIRAELLNLSREGYSKDYEELIRKYFEALEKEKEK